MIAHKTTTEKTSLEHNERPGAGWFLLVSSFTTVWKLFVVLWTTCMSICTGEYDARKGAVGNRCIRIQHYTAGSSIRWSREATSFVQFDCNSTCPYVGLKECCHNILNLFIQSFRILTEDGVCVQETFLCECVSGVGKLLALIALVVRAPVTCDTRIHQSMM